MNTTPPEERISQIFKAVGSPARLRILTAIGADEACVCHLEALLDLRQAYISQQLMEMRTAGLVETRRDGRYIFYSLTEPKLLDTLIDIGKLFDIPTDPIESSMNAETIPECCCPNCVARLET